MPHTPLPLTFYDRSAADVAPDLLGRWLVHSLDDRRLVARIVETEAYLGREDRASHAWGGRRTRRNESLYLSPGHAYVYLIYGLHHCLNAVTGGNEEGGAVLIRAVEPLSGVAAMGALRGLGVDPRPGDIGGGPGKLCQALAIDRALDGARLDDLPVVVAEGDKVPAATVARGPRIGVAYSGEAADWSLRFALAGNRHVSRPRL